MNANKRSSDRPPGAALLRLCVCATLFVIAAGCRNRSDLVEAELRTREREVHQLRSDLQRAETLNSAMEGELRSRQGVALPFPPPGEIIDRPLALMANTVQRIELGRGTGGIDEDKWPGDEALQIVITPRDGEGSAIKAPGYLVVKVFEVSIEGLKVPLCKWDVSAADLQKTWRSGVFASGYFVTLPWKNWPNSEKLRVVAQFATLPDHRWFEADRDVTIRLMPGAPRPGPTALPSGSMPIGPPASSPPVPLPTGRNEPLPPPPIEGPKFPEGATGQPAARLKVARPAPPIEERLQQRFESAKPAPRDSLRVEPPTAIDESGAKPLRVEAPPMFAEPVAPEAPPTRLLPPLPPAK